MTNTSHSEFNSPTDICEWLNDGTTPEDLKIETDHPWARTYCLPGKTGRRFVKDIPSNQSAAISALPQLSAQFPDVVPNTLAVDQSLGLVLLDDHGGEDLDSSPTYEQKQKILVTYATVQAKAAQNEKLISSLPGLNLSELMPALLRFLDPTGAGHEFAARARDFISEERCRFYFELLQVRAARISELIQQASCMPLTVNHCDLRSRNTAARENGDLVIYDWDEAVAAPAGLSIHKSFSGCYVPCEMLLDPVSANTEERSAHRILLSSYLQTLTTNGYCQHQDLNRGLPGALCAGVIHYILSYGKFPPEGSSYRDTVGDILRRRLRDLLKLGDLLLFTDRAEALASVADYRQRERTDHAIRVLDRFTAIYPDDAEAADQLTGLLGEVKNAGTDIHAIYQRHLERSPESSSVHRNYGIALLNRLELDAAVDHLTQAVKLGAGDDALALALDEAVEYRDVCRQAAQPGRVPTIRVSKYEQVSGKMRPSRQRLAVQLYHQYGTLLIENALPESTVKQMHQEYLDSYQQYFENDRPGDALRVGSKRYMITVDLQGAFNSPSVYANPHVAPIIQDVLGGSMILGGFVSTCSLPGSQNMRVHKDHTALFPESDNPDALPTFAVTAVVPLRGFTEEAGTTRVWKRSHNCSRREAAKMESQDPLGPQGSILLMDYRLTHQGRANQSNRVRPILTMIYHRPWFRDIVNYGKQDPVRIADEEYQQVPEEHKHLFAWTRCQELQGR